MTASLSMPDFFISLTALQKEQGLTSTLLGIGPMSKRIVRVALQAANRRNFPIMFIASRNQVDLKGLGGGYVCSWDQQSFVETIGELAEQVRFSGLCYVCRDHGGPWQRDSERREKLSPDAAMEIAKRSYLEDLLRGFDLLHIDPTKDPHAEGVNELETVIERTAALIEYVEKERRKRELSAMRGGRRQVLLAVSRGSARTVQAVRAKPDLALGRSLCSGEGDWSLGSTGSALSMGPCCGFSMGHIPRSTRFGLEAITMGYLR